MTEQNQQAAGAAEHKKSPIDSLFNGLLIVVIAVGGVYLIAQHPSVAWKALLVALGFGAVVMIHELGHFIAAKLCGIQIEAFAIGFPPVLFSIQKRPDGFRFRFMPHGESQEPCEATEYCIGLLPFGGYVKMLGQSDTGTVQKNDNPRSFLNKAIWQRIVVVAAGVVFNAVGAMILFMALFMHGLELAPPIVGGVMANSPAEVAGLKTGDRIIAINDKEFLDFSSISLAAALSDKDKPVEMVVRKSDGTTAQVKMIAERAVEDPTKIKAFGIQQAMTLKVYQSSADSKFRDGDIITAVNGKPVSHFWQLNDIASHSLTPSVTLTVSRKQSDSSAATQTQIEIPMLCQPTRPNFRNEYDLSHIYSMVPRTKVVYVSEISVSQNAVSRFKNWFDQTIWRKPAVKVEKKAGLEAGDIIVKIGNIANPTYKDIRLATIDNRDKELPVVVLRADAAGRYSEKTIVMQPSAKPGDNGRITLGFVAGLDMDHPVVAQTIDSAAGPGALNIPQGATIVAVDGQPVSNFYDVIRLIRANPGQRISIEYRTAGDGGAVGLVVPEQDAIHALSMFEDLPVETFREIYKADNPATAVSWGIRRSWQFMEQSIMTFKGLFTRQVPGSALTGPVGIVSISYKLAGQGLMDFLNFLGLLSSCLVVMNLLPLPIVDGGLIVLLIIEKIRGVPLNMKIQEAITYVGLALLLSLFAWVTYNDLLRVIFGK